MYEDVHQGVEDGKDTNTGDYAGEDTELGRYNFVRNALFLTFLLGIGTVSADARW